MRDFAANVEIAAAPARVWAVMRDVERWHEWTASIREIRRLDDGPFRVGSRWRIRQPRLLPGTWTVTELEEGRGFTWVTRGPGAVVTARHSIEAAPGGSLVRLSLRFEGWLGGVLGAVGGRLTRRYIALEAEGLKRRSEG